jgi:methyltransferase (TIGR00027 family)
VAADPSRPSRTAEYVALFRALETVRPAARRLFEDRLAEPLLSPELRAVVALARVPVSGRLVYEIIDRLWPGSRLWVVVRTRYIDDRVRGAIQNGVTQVMLLGAGFDARAHRIEHIRRTLVFEVDEPATLRRKREPHGGAGRSTEHVRYVALDFETDDLVAALRAAGFHADLPSIVVWEGVTSYLSADAVDASFRSLAAATAPGSTIVFTYLHPDVLEGARAAGARAAARAVRRAGEPFRFGLDPDRVADYLEERGFELSDNRSCADLARTYLGATGPAVPGFYRIAVARRAG